MRAIVNGKLYDTDKARHVSSLTEENEDETIFEIYITQKGNVFAADTINNIIFDSEQLKKLLERKPGCVDAYIEIFGMPEEA